MCCWLDTKYKRYLITRNCSKTISFCSLNYKNEGKQNRASWVFVTKQCFISCQTRCTSIEWVENHWILLQNILLYTYYQSTDIIPWAFQVSTKFSLSGSNVFFVSFVTRYIIFIGILQYQCITKILIYNLIQINFKFCKNRRMYRLQLVHKKILFISYSNGQALKLTCPYHFNLWICPFYMP